MFSDLSTSLDGIFKTLRGHGKLSEANVADALKQVRRALLEADVNYKVARDFIKEVEAESLGEKVLRSVAPGQQIVKIVHDRLVLLLGGEHRQPRFAKGPRPTVWMLIGLQGSGKTTACGKLARFYQRAGRNVQLIAADLARPAAVEQLRVLGRKIGVPVHSDPSDPVRATEKGLDAATKADADLIILDTAGRLHIDAGLMDELGRVKAAADPTEVFLVSDAMTGQDAVQSAGGFDEQIGFDGSILTKIDGDARGGAALSIVKVTGRPIMFVGTGEKLEDLEPFHPDRMASRILGMGDVVTLVEKAQEAIDIEQVEKWERKLKRAEFDFEDFYEQLQQIKQMGPLENVLGMIPGLGKQLKGLRVDEGAQARMEAIILSMTLQERRNPHLLNGSRRLRIARGSGNSIQDVNRLLKQFQQMQKMMRKMTKGGKRMPKLNLPGMGGV